MRHLKAFFLFKLCALILLALSPLAAKDFFSIPMKEHPSGNIRHLSEFTADYLLINYWAYWCSPCKAEFPKLQEISEQYPESLLKVVGITVDVTGKEKEIDAFLKKMGTRFTILLDALAASPPLLNVIGLPTTVILNRKGEEIARVEGYSDKKHEELKSILSHLK